MSAIVEAPATVEAAANDAAARGRSVAERMGNVDLIDAFIFGLFIFDRVTVVAFPGGVALAALIAAVAFLRRPTIRVSVMPWLQIGYVTLLGYLFIVSEMGGMDWRDRLLRFFLLGLLAWALAEGRMDAFSAVAGVSIGLILNVAAFYAGLTPRVYGSFLTGFFSDKNVAGLWYALFGILGLWLWRTWQMKTAWYAMFSGFIFLTGSRTSIAAMLVGGVWILIRNRFGGIPRLTLAASLMALLNYAEENLARVGVFADRAGSDWFREQIAAAASAKLADAPWYGMGLGQATVILEGGRHQFFHNSYDALRVEGGWPLLIGWVVVLVLIVGRLTGGRRAGPDRLYAEGALVASLVCAWKLGEVFFTSSVFIVMGICIAYHLGRPMNEGERTIWQS